VAGGGQLETHQSYPVDQNLWIQGGHLPGKPGKVKEFDIGQGKVREIVVCLWCATAVATVAE